MAIEWTELLSGKFIKLITGQPKVLTLTNWRIQDKFKDEKTDELRKGLTFDVIGEDDKTYTNDEIKEWTVTAIRAMVKLRPIIEKADVNGKKTVKIRVVRVGEGKATAFSIDEIN